LHQNSHYVVGLICQTLQSTGAMKSVLWVHPTQKSAPSPLLLEWITIEGKCHKNV